MSDPERAVAVLDATSDLIDSIPDRPFDRARFALLHGQLLRQVGDTDRAEPVLRQAQATFFALGAAPWFADTSEELICCGVRPEVRPDMPGGLTAHEGRVAGLVAESLTNRQVAAELVVSVKTVSYHLGNIYAKLGVHSRVQMVKALNEPDQTAPR